MEEGAGLTKVLVDVWVILEKNAVDLELNFVDFIALFVVVDSHCELVTVVSEIVWNTEGLGKGLCMPTLPWLAIDVKRDQSTSEVMLNRDRSSVSLQED